MSRYLIVGHGLAGSVLAEVLDQAAHEVVVIDAEYSNTASKAANGLLNPITGRRLVRSWRVDELFPRSFAFYEQMDRAMETDHFKHLEVFRLLADQQTQTDWLARTAEASYTRYMATAELVNAPVQLKAPNATGFIIKPAARLDCPGFLGSLKSRRNEKGQYMKEAFDLDALELLEKGLQYGSEYYDRLVFCEGNAVLDNPFFDWLPIGSTKGQALLGKMMGLPNDLAVAVGLIFTPASQGLTYVGSTVEWHNRNAEPDEAGKLELLKKYAAITKMPFEIKKQLSGIRPASKDRRPILGVHPKHPQLAVLNGLGTKGVSLAPSMADELIAHLEEGKALHPEADLQRFGHLCPE